MTPPSASRALGTATRFLVAALMVAGVAGVLRAREQRLPEGVEAYLEESLPGAPACAPVSACGPQILQDMPGHPTVEESEACRDGAYLCAGLVARRRPARVLRWGDGVSALRVRVRWPDEEGGLAARHQQGAVRGLRVWDGHPIRLRVESEPQPLENPNLRGENDPVVGRRNRAVSRRAEPTADFDLTWTVAPRTTEMGETYASWGADGRRGGYGLGVTSMSVPMVDRWPGGRGLTDREVEAAAAHAMGHALGLPHSPSPADVMYPGNTALTPSPGDLRAVATLYALPNGAEIRLGEDPSQETGP